MAGLVASGSVPEATDLRVTGAGEIGADSPDDYCSTTATWQGAAVRDGRVSSAVFEAECLTEGMRGAPVRRAGDDQVVGVVSAAHYGGSTANRPRSVWATRIEDLLPLLAEMPDVALADKRLAGTPLDLTLTVTADSVRLRGAGTDVRAPHGGTGPGLDNALKDVFRERVHAVPRDARSDRDVVGRVSLRLTGELVADTFLPARVRDALAVMLTRARRETAPVRLAVDAPAYGRLPWESMPDPISGMPLALHPLVSVFRRVPAGSPSPRPGPLRIVVAIASPESGGTLPGLPTEEAEALRGRLAARGEAQRAGL